MHENELETELSGLLHENELKNELSGLLHENELKNELSKLMHEIMIKNKSIIEAGDYSNLLSLCEQDIAILAFINDKTGITAKEISSVLGVPKTTVVTAVVRLEKRGYIIREKNELDKREMFLLLTEKGIKANSEHFNYENIILEALANRWSLEDQKLLSEVLKRREDF